MVQGLGLFNYLNWTKSSSHFSADRTESADIITLRQKIIFFKFFVEIPDRKYKLGSLNNGRIRVLAGRSPCPGRTSACPRPIPSLASFPSAVLPFPSGPFRLRSPALGLPA